MVSDPNLKFYLTPEHGCSYFQDRKATTLFVDPLVEFNTNRLALLTEHGFRRSGDYIYRPHCRNCQACQSLRILVDGFTPSRSQKRCLLKNDDLQAQILKPNFQLEHYQLYQQYINNRHCDGDMYPATEAQYRSFLLSDFKTARLVEFRTSENILVAISILDLFPDALSAIYSFFSPDSDHRSLGTYIILWQINYCRTERLKHLYLGYYIQDSKKMSYKNKFKPFELYKNDTWTSLP